jgi:hypothetical protein
VSSDVETWNLKGDVEGGEMSRRNWLLLGGILGIFVVGVVGWYLLSPLIIDRSVDEELPFEIPDETEFAEMNDADREAVQEEVLATAAAMPEKSMEEPMPSGAEPTILRMGLFVDADNFHQGEGTATIYQLADGSLVLRLEAFMVTNGPDLHVLLAEGTSPTNRDELGEYVDLGSLKGNVGNQNYDLPDDVSIDRYESVVIYCVPFHVVFSTANLS